MIGLFILLAFSASCWLILKCLLDLQEDKCLDVALTIDQGEIEELEHLWRVSQ